MACLNSENGQPISLFKGQYEQYNHQKNQVTAKEVIK